MFGRFTEAARQAVVDAQDESRLLGHDFLGTEHLLLGLLCGHDGVAVRVLADLEVSLAEVRLQVARIVGRGEASLPGMIPFTPRAKRALEAGLREALSMGEQYVGPEHILIGIARESGGVGARVLRDFDASAETLRGEVERARTGRRRRETPADEIRRGVMEGLDVPARPALLVSCPVCGTVLELVTAAGRETGYDASADDERTCPTCGKRWRLAYRVSLSELPDQSPGGA